MCSFKPLLNPKTPFKWTEELQAKFEKSKAILAKVIEERVRIFNQYQKTCRSPDWLWKQHCKCPLDTPECCVERWKMTLAVSYFLWSPKQCYTLVEEKALAISWALENTKVFTLGFNNLQITTDHSATLLPLDDITNTRIFHLKQHTLTWQFKIFHVLYKLIAMWHCQLTLRNPATSPDHHWERMSEYKDHVRRWSIIDCLENDIIPAFNVSLEKIKATIWNTEWRTKHL